MLNIIERFVSMMGLSHGRLDGNTPVGSRQVSEHNFIPCFTPGTQQDLPSTWIFFSGEAAVYVHILRVYHALRIVREREVLQ